MYHKDHRQQKSIKIAGNSPLSTRYHTDKRKEVDHMTPVKAIRVKCLDCCCNSANEVKACELTTCSLHPFRLGKNPNKKPREYTPEQLETLRQRLQKANLAKKLQ